MAENPFLNCKVKGRFVDGEFWRLEAANHSEAQRICEIINGAYRAGWNAKVEQIMAALTTAEE